MDGVGINACARICDVSKLTVLRLLADVGSLCLDMHDLHVQKVRSQRIQVDEIWSFVGCKQRNVQKSKNRDIEIGDAWTWIGLDSDTKLVVSYHVGGRGADSARRFLFDLVSRIDGRIQLSSDGHAAYFDAVQAAFGPDGVDYAQVTKVFGSDPQDDSRYSPPQCTGCRKLEVFGLPDRAAISTSHVERQNLTLRISNRRLTRLTLGFSKKWQNHVYAIALHYFNYNFCRRHKTLKTTPAIAAGITDREWTISDLVGLLEREEETHANGGRINRGSRS